MSSSTDRKKPSGVGNVVAPPRFIAFALIAMLGVGVGTWLLGWRIGAMAGFDVAAIVFLVSCIPLLDDETADIREAARRNDANRAGLLAITGAVTIVILVAVASELMQKGKPEALDIALIVGTLVLAWAFSNMIYALHYVHMFYIEHEGEIDEVPIIGTSSISPSAWA